MLSESIGKALAPGPNGFFRRFTGSFLDRGAGLTVQETYVGPKQAIRLILTNGGADEVQLVITNAYAVDSVTASLAAGQTVLRDVSLAARHEWYDILVTMPAAPRFGVQLAGHVETDADSFTDPMMS